MGKRNARAKAEVSEQVAEMRRYNRLVRKQYRVPKPREGKQQNENG